MLETNSQVILAANMSVDINRRAKRIIELIRDHYNGINGVNVPSGHLAVFVGTLECNPDKDPERINVYYTDTNKFNQVFKG